MLSCTNKNRENVSIRTYSEIIDIIDNDFDISRIDSLQNLLLGNKIDNFQFTELNGNVVDIDKIEKPIFLEATASWCKPCKALTPALNEIVEKYSNQIEFVLLTHDTKERAEIFSTELHPRVKLVPSKTKKNPNSVDKLDVGDFKHILPFPTTYFINTDKMISEIKIGAPLPTDNSEEEINRINQMNMKDFSLSIEKLIQEKPNR